MENIKYIHNLKEISGSLGEIMITYLSDVQVLVKDNAVNK